MMHFTVEEENLICMYHNADRRRTIGKITAAMPGMDGDMWTLAQQTLSKLKRMTDSDWFICLERFAFSTGLIALQQQTPGAAAMWPLASGVFFCLFLRI